MKKNWKKLLALVLTMAMVLSLSSVSSLAAGFDRAGLLKGAQTVKRGGEAVAVKPGTDAGITPVAPHLEDDEPEAFAGDPALFPAAVFEGVTGQEAGAVSVRVDAPVGAFPAGTEMTVRPVDMQKIQEAVDAAEGISGVVYAAADITFTFKGREIQPEKSVKVRMDSEIMAVAEDPLAIIHLDVADPEADEPEYIPEPVDEAPAANGESAVVFEAEKFSVYAAVGAAPEAAPDQPAPVITPGGPYVLNADGDTFPAPDAHKTLTPNGDGTSTLSLSITGKATSSDVTEAVKSNLLVVMDRSNSMLYATTYSYSENTYDGTEYYYYQQNWGNNTNPNSARNQRRVYYDTTIKRWYYTGQNHWDNTGGTWQITDHYYLGANANVYVSRLTATQMALRAMVNTLLQNNTPGSAALADVIEMQIISFGSYRGNAGTGTHPTESAWSTSETTLMNAVNNDTTYGGTNWQAALEYAKLEADAKKQAQPDETVYVIFMTDGEPTFYGHGTSTTRQYQGGTEIDGYRGNGNSYDATGQSAADTAAKNLVDAGHELYGIFAFGSGNTQANYLRRTVYYGYEGAVPTTNTQRNKYDGTNFFDATNIDNLLSAFENIISHITQNIGYGQVSFNDGISTDVTASTLVAGQADGFRYTVKGATGGALYSVTAEGTGADTQVVFTVGGNKYDSTTTPAVVKKTDTESGKDYYSVTIGQNEYKMALASLTNGEVVWDLAAIGTLMNEYTYEVSFLVWPNQEAYDFLANLQNGLDGYEWDTTTQVPYEVDGKVVYWTHGVEDYPNIVRYPNGTYEILTNTHQMLSYSIATTETDEEGNSRTVYVPQEPIQLDPAEPMELTGSQVFLQKVWAHDLDTDQLAELVFGKDFKTNPVYTGYKVTLSVTEDGKPYKSFTFPRLSENGKPVNEQGEETTDINELIWADILTIAPGIMISEEEAAKIGLNVTGYTKVYMKEMREVVPEGGSEEPGEGEGGEEPAEPTEPEMEEVTVTYYILDNPGGHDYEIKETEGADLHFEFTTVVYHLMLVDGVLWNITFETGADGKVVDGSTATVNGEDPVESVKGINSLKGGINIFKYVSASQAFVQADDEGYTVVNADIVEDCEDEFTFTVTLKDKDGNPVFSDPSTYTLDDDGNLASYTSGFLAYNVYDKDGKRLEGKKGRGPIPASGVVTVAMPANGSMRVVNVPAGTQYTVVEVEDATKAYNYLLTVGELQEGGDTENPHYQKYTDKNDYSGEIKANSASIVSFYNWASYFYIYHSSDNTIEKVNFTDSRVKGTYDAENNKYTYKMDLTAEVLPNTLYGGYYKAYKGAALTDAEIIALETYQKDFGEEDRFKDRLWQKDTEGTAYSCDYIKDQSMNVWTWADAYTVKGTEALVENNKVYYLKEVPTAYLQPYTHYTYYKADNTLGTLWNMTATDDLNYTGVGLDIQEVGKDVEKMVKNLTVRTEHGGTKVTLTAAKVFRAKGVKLGWLGYVTSSDVIGKKVVITQWWKTPDTVQVYGTMQRELDTTGKTVGSVKVSDTPYTPAEPEEPVQP